MGRTQKSIRNIFFGLAYQAVSVLSSFLCRTALIKYLGLDTVSLHSLFWEIVSMLSLAELGIGTAIVYHLYKPLAEGDTEAIKSIMGLYRKCYRIIAGVCFFGGCIVTTFVPVFVNGLSFSNSYLRWVFFLYVMQMSVSYLFAADPSLIQADQKRYRTVILQTAFKAGTTAVSLLVLYLFGSFTLYLAVSILSTLLQNISCTIQARSLYPYLKEQYTSLDKEETKGIFTNVRDIFLKRVAGYVTNSTDNICISLLVGTVQVGLYSNYSMLFSAVRQIEQQIAGGFSASMGNLAAKESSDKIDRTLCRMESYFQLFGMIMSGGLMACSSTFISIWIGDSYNLSSTVVAICCVNTYLTIVKEPLWQVMDACGLFSYDRNLAVASTLLNLIVSVILGLKWGMFGIFVGTAASTVFEVVFKTHGIYRKLMVSCRGYAYLLIKMAVSESIVLLLSCLAVSFPVHNLYVRFLCQGSVSVLASVTVYMTAFSSEAKRILENLSEKIRKDSRWERYAG